MNDKLISTIMIALIISIAIIVINGYFNNPTPIQELGEPISSYWLVITIALTGGIIAFYQWRYSPIGEAE